MHLGLLDGSFVPHNLISAQRSPLPLLKFQIAPRLKILMSSGSKKYTFLFLSKVMANEHPPGSQRGPYGKRYPFTGPFCMSLESIIKIPQNKKIFFLSKALSKERPSMFLKNGVPMDTNAHFQSLT